MATSEEYLTFVCEQIARFGAVRYRKMFGDATVYLDDKPILLVCDNTVFVKCLPETAALLSDAGTGTPYDGARPHYMLDIDNAALLDTLIPVLAACTPLPKPRKKKAKPCPNAAQMRGIYSCENRSIPADAPVFPCVWIQFSQRICCVSASGYAVSRALSRSTAWSFTPVIWRLS